MNKNELYDIYPMCHVPFWQTTWFYALIAIILGLILVIGIIYCIKKIRARALIKTPWDQALYDLHILYKNHTEQDCKKFYSSLTTILKKYLSARYSINMMGNTDQEMIANAQTSQVPAGVVQALQSILEGGVLIKFGNAQGVRDHMQRDFQAAVSIVKTTIPLSLKK